MRTKLLSIGQLQENRYEISVKDGVYIIQDEKLGLIDQVNMTANQMFPLYLHNTTHSYVSMRLKEQTWLWHFFYGHLNFGGLKTPQQKSMVTVLSQIRVPFQVYEQCVVSKKHWNQFPQGKSQRAKKVLELVHSHICGLINPSSNGSKKIYNYLHWWLYLENMGIFFGNQKLW